VGGPAPAVAEVRLAVRKALAELPAGALVLVACSGGADSLALAAAVAFEAPRSGLRAGMITVDHGWDPSSTQQAAQVVRQSSALGLAPAEAVRVECARTEDSARQARRAALLEAADRLDAATVLLGHTLTDQAETVLMRLARGSGARSLAGMPRQDGLIRRPLLAVSRATTEAACVAEGILVWTDPSNADPAYTRARVRTGLLPVLREVLGAGAVASLARSADLLREDADALDLLTPSLWRAEAWGSSVAVDKLAGLPAALRARVLRRMALDVGAPPTALGQVHVQAIRALVERWSGQGSVDLPGGCKALRRDGRIHLVSAAGSADGSVAVAVKAGDTPGETGNPDIESVLVSAEEIDVRVRALAAAIDADYAGREVLLVGVLKGAVMVMADLSRCLTVPATMEFMAVSSYGTSTSSSGVVRILKDLDRSIEGRHVLVVEDIIDSGLTLSWLLRNLSSRAPASVEVVALLRKPEALAIDLDVKYVGFDIPSAFVVGYGLDYAERYRTLPFIGTLTEDAIRRGGS
jgi:tRNA(Ile)-lysidine synthase